MIQGSLFKNIVPSRTVSFPTEDEPCGKPGCVHKAECYQQEIGPDALCIKVVHMLEEKGLRRIT